MTHRLTVQFDAKLAFDLHLPADDVALIRDQTLIRVVVEPSSAADDCSHYSLKIRLGEGEAAQDYEQARFVHQSAATGAATCLLHYLASKKKLNVDADVFGITPLGLGSSDGHTFVPVGWTVARIEGKRVVATHGERLTD